MAMMTKEQERKQQERKKWGAVVKKARMRKGLSQEEMARAWGHTLSYVQKIEVGQKGNEDTCRDLLELLDEQRAPNGNGHGRKRARRSA